MDASIPPAFFVSDFIRALNQTLEFSYSYVEIQGEITNLRISKNKWVYFDLKDESASLKCFATIYALPGPLEDGMVVRVAGSPRLHPLYNFSFQVQSIIPVGEGSLRKAAELLALKLKNEGLFDTARKRSLPFPPQRIALVTAGDSAAYADFMKIKAARWPALKVDLHNVLVQGDKAPGEIIAVLRSINESEQPVDVVVMIRGGGSAEDLAAWSDERVVRAVAGSRVPTLVAIGHEVDVSLAELAADSRASTPSNAAELLLPDRNNELRHLRLNQSRLDELFAAIMIKYRTEVGATAQKLDEALRSKWSEARQYNRSCGRLLAAYDPLRPLQQGYALVHTGGRLIDRAGDVKIGDSIEVKFTDGIIVSQVKKTMLINNGGDI